LWVGLVFLAAEESIIGHIVRKIRALQARKH
jgi:hypothetical protein